MEAGPSRSRKTEIQAVLDPFLAVLRSSSPITIPPATLLGAITHFLSTLDNADLCDFIYALLTSPSLWSLNTAPASQIELREAVRLSVSAKLALIEKDVNNRYFAQVRTIARARDWLARIIQPASDISDRSKSKQTSIVAFHVALLEGMDDVRVDWGNARIKVEEEIVLALCDESQDMNSELVCAALPHVDIVRLKALDVKNLISVIEDRLVGELETSADEGRSREVSTSDISCTAKALARCFSVLNSTSNAKDRKYAWGVMMRFCRRLHDIGIQGSKKWHAGNSSFSDEMWGKHKSSLFAFLLASSTILDILLHSNFPPSLLPETNVHPSADLAGHVLWALSTFSYLTDGASAGIENYHRILYGHLDVLATKGGVDATDKLLRHLLDDLNDSDGKDGAKVAYVLVIAEELKNMLSRKSIGPLLSLAERHVNRPEHQASFEASHAFLLGLLRSSVQPSSSAQHLNQEAFFDALLPFYLSRLTKQFIQGQITSDQFRSAYPLIAEAASSRSPSSVQYVLSALSQLPPSSDRRIVQIKITPYIPSDRLVSYLNDLAEMVLAIEEGSEERLDVVRAAFKLVVEDLGDEVKGLGVAWWIDRRERFEGRQKVDQGFIRSRL